ncbi:unnamed protein product, partial [Staurois parvus]
MCRYGWIRAGWMDGRVVSVVRQAGVGNSGGRSVQSSRQRVNGSQAKVQQQEVK